MPDANTATTTGLGTVASPETATTNSYGHGIAHYGGGLWVDNLIVHAMPRAGIIIQGLANEPSANFVITNNIVKNVGWCCIQLGTPYYPSNYSIIANNLVFDDQQTPTMHYGISVNALPADNYIIAKNVISGAINVNVSDGGTGTNKSVVSNVGYNPSVAYDITVGSSPFTYTNNNQGNPAIVTVRGGTVSSIQYKRGATSITLGITTGEIMLAQNDSVVVTYKATPTMEKFPLVQPEIRIRYGRMMVLIGAGTFRLPRILYISTAQTTEQSTARQGQSYQTRVFRRWCPHSTQI
jgi:hypothetical protein